MSSKHYKQQLSAFANQEMSKEDRHTIAEHLMHCDDCRREFQHLKLGAALAAKLAPSDAPEELWRSIESEVDGQAVPSLNAFASPRWFDLKHVGAFATAILLVGLLAVLVYRGLYSDFEVSSDGALPSQLNENGSAGQPLQISEVTKSNSTTAIGPDGVNANIAPVNETVAATWTVETITGSPRVGDAVAGSKLAVGEYLETDARSRARIEVAEIGNVEIAPNSRVRLIGTGEKQHRLSLERGLLHARIAAPPRLFIVDTPSAAAVDLGCEYTLEVDRAGNSKLIVKTGFVSLENGGRESIVPAGASCLTMKGKGLGTPFSTEATPEFEQALRSFDFGNGGSGAVKAIVKESDLYDIVSLWHLLARVKPADRGLVFDSLSRFVAPPEGVTRDGVLSLNKQMLEKYRAAVEAVWFE